MQGPIDLARRQADDHGDGFALTVLEVRRERYGPHPDTVRAGQCSGLVTPSTSEDRAASLSASGLISGP